MRFKPMHMKECGPGEVWWVFDTDTNRFTSWSLSSRKEALEVIKEFLL